MADPSGLTRGELERMAAAACEIRECERVLAKTGDTILSEIVCDGAAEAWRHYPEGDVYDPESHAQYYYHSHPRAASGSGPAHDEHGHFHTFLRPRGMSEGTAPLILPELAIAGAPAAPADPLLAPVAQPNQGGNNDKLSHLVGIAMNARGTPVRLFTTNRWVTGETWYAAADVGAMLERFTIDLARPSWPVNRWLSALFRLFRSDMRALISARDAAIMSWRRRHRGKVHVFEDRRLEIASAAPIDLEARIGWVEDALRRAA
jgi:hypothetical protein